mmetsp:Transcript_24023/g.78156  ORF Transcript_24023/g.78156 Transcript_24023/m.78156 type:complete len:258 (+) Transcript_24023:2365-3138(+)
MAPPRRLAAAGVSSPQREEPDPAELRGGRGRDRLLPARRRRASGGQEHSLYPDASQNGDTRSLDQDRRRLLPVAQAPAPRQLPGRLRLLPVQGHGGQPGRGGGGGGGAAAGGAAGSGDGERGGFTGEGDGDGAGGRRAARARPALRGDEREAGGRLPQAPQVDLQLLQRLEVARVLREGARAVEPGKVQPDLCAQDQLPLLHRLHRLHCPRPPHGAGRRHRPCLLKAAAVHPPAQGQSGRPRALHPPEQASLRARGG